MELTIKQTIEKTVTLELPKFWKMKNDYGTEYLGVPNEKQVIVIIDRDTYRHLSHCEMWLKKPEVQKASVEWEEISEEDFLNAHREFLASMSLEPQLTDPDDLGGVNI